MRRIITIMAGLALLAAACTSGDDTAGAEEPTTTTAADSTTTAAPQTQYQATIRRTTHNIPHIVAADYGSLGFGQGYALAEDHACTLADRVVRANAQLARYHGEGELQANLNSDLALLHLGVPQRAAEDFAALDADSAAMVQGFAAGYNAYLTATGIDNLPGFCAGAEWVRPITELDLMAVYKQLALLASGDQILDFIALATPPLSGDASGPPTDRAFDPPAGEVLALGAGGDLGSNGWGLGTDVTENGRGILFSNPHFPWEGALRFWESHLTIPGELNVYGVSLIGTPGVQIGFNEAVAWAHMVSPGNRLTGYTLSLDPDDPTRYLYDGESRAMVSQDISVEVLGEDGSVETVTRTMWSSHYGPIIDFPGVGWSGLLTITYRDANIDNQALIPQFLAINRAGSMDQYQAAQEEYQGIPWVHSVAVSSEGEAWYIDSTPTPNLSDEAIALWQEKLETDFITSVAFDNGFIVLDGSDSTFEWQEEPGARDPGLVPFQQMPQLERSDWVFNSNDSYWLSNPAQPITDVSPLHGFVGTAQSPRTRQNLVVLTDDSPTGPRGEDGLWSFEEVKEAALDNRSFMASLLTDELLAACDGAAPVQIDEVTNVDLSKACEVLAGWDRAFNLDSRGAVLFREWINRYPSAALTEPGLLLFEPLDPADPIGTPAVLADPTAALAELAGAVLVLDAAGLALDVPLGEVQFADRNGVRVPIHGGTGQEGITNLIGWSAQSTTTEPLVYQRGERIGDSRDLTADGYPIASGGSFVIVVEFTADGPRADAFLTYGQTGDRDSEFFADQTRLYSDKAWRPVAFEEADIVLELVEAYDVSG